MFVCFSFSHTWNLHSPTLPRERCVLQGLHVNISSEISCFLCLHLNTNQTRLQAIQALSLHEASLSRLKSTPFILKNVWKPAMFSRWWALPVELLWHSASFQVLSCLTQELLANFMYPETDKPMAIAFWSTNKMPSQIWNHTLAYECGLIYLSIAMLLLAAKRRWCPMWVTLAQLSYLATAQQEVQWYSAGLTEHALKFT